MKKLTLLLLLGIASCKQEEPPTQKTLIFTFFGTHGYTIGRTGIEPATNTVVEKSEFSRIGDLALHSNGKVYAAGGAEDAIFVYENLNISERKRVYTGGSVFEIAVDAVNNKIYWEGYHSGVVFSTNISAPDPWTKLFGEKPVIGQCGGMVVDPARNKLFMIDQADPMEILVGNLNSSSAPVVLVSSATFEMFMPQELVISEDGNTLYWADETKINRTDAATGASATFIETDVVASLYLHYPTNSLYVALGKTLYKTSLELTPKLEVVWVADYEIDNFVVL